MVIPLEYKRTSQSCALMLMLWGTTWHLKMWPVRFSETSLTGYHCTLPHISLERRRKIHRGRNLASRVTSEDVETWNTHLLFSVPRGHFKLFFLNSKHGRNVKSGPPRAGLIISDLEARPERLKILTSNRKGWHSAAEWLDLGLEGLICKNYDSTEKYNIRTAVGPR